VSQDVLVQVQLSAPLSNTLRKLPMTGFYTGYNTSKLIFRYNFPMNNKIYTYEEYIELEEANSPLIADYDDFSDYRHKTLLQALDVGLDKTEHTTDEIIRGLKLDLFYTEEKSGEQIWQEQRKRFFAERDLEELQKEFKAVKTEEDLIKLKMALEKDVIDEYEFELIHSYGKDWQRRHRNRQRNPLPVRNLSKIDGSNVGKKNVRSKKIFYNRLEVAQWVDEYI
jgi:hypothetical protein